MTNINELTETREFRLADLDKGRFDLTVESSRSGPDSSAPMGATQALVARVLCRLN